MGNKLLLGSLLIIFSHDKIIRKMDDSIEGNLIIKDYICL